MPLLTARRFFLITGGFALFGLATIIFSPMVGAVPVNPLRATLAWLAGPQDSPSIEVDIFIYQRLPRVLLAFLTGAALATVGAVFQALLRNPLATPYTLGVSSGGSFGAVVAILALPTLAPAFTFHWGPFNHVQIFAFFGSLLAMGMIYFLARSGEGIAPMELLLAGVVMGAIFSSLILAVRYFSDPRYLVNMDRWMMGNLEVVGYRDLGSVVVFLAPALAVLLAQARGLDQVSFGEQLAGGRGVNVARMQKVCFLMGSLATAAVVAVAGPIAFVGLIVPHTVRQMIGADHRLMLPCVLFAGGGFLVLCDTVARTIIAPTLLPVGIVTALLGGPFFIYLLVRGRRRGRLWMGEK